MRTGGPTIQPVLASVLRTHQATTRSGQGKNRPGQEDGENRLRHAEKQLGIRRLSQLHLGRLTPASTRLKLTSIHGRHTKPHEGKPGNEGSSEPSSPWRFLG